MAPTHLSYYWNGWVVNCDCNMSISFIKFVWLSCGISPFWIFVLDQKERKPDIDQVSYHSFIHSVLTSNIIDRMHQCCMQFSYVIILKLIYNLFNLYLLSILAGQTPIVSLNFTILAMMHTEFLKWASNQLYETSFFAFCLLFYILIVGSSNGILTWC